MNIERVQVGLLNSAIYNPRKDLQPSDAEYIKLKNSIEHFGYVDPIIVNKRNNVVVGGHQRLKVLRDLGYEEIEVVYVDLNDTDEKALNIALNKISGDWDAEKLEDLIREIKLDTDFDLELTGFSLDEVEIMFSGSLDDNNIIAEICDKDNEFLDDINEYDLVDIKVTINNKIKNVTAFKINKHCIDDQYNTKTCSINDIKKIINILENEIYEEE